MANRVRKIFHLDLAELTSHLIDMTQDIPRKHTYDSVGRSYWLRGKSTKSEIKVYFSKHFSFSEDI